MTTIDDCWRQQLWWGTREAGVNVDEFRASLIQRWIKVETSLCQVVDLQANFQDRRRDLSTRTIQM